MSSSESPVTAQDIESLNRASVERSAAFARIVGAAFVAAASLSLVLWAWLTYRTQERAESFSLAVLNSFESESPSIATRIDTVVATLPLLLSAATLVALGLGLRLAADYTQTRVGGSVTGFKVGDAFPADDEEPDEESNDAQM